MTPLFIIEKQGWKIGLKLHVHKPGACLIYSEGADGLTIHADLDLRDLTLLSAEIDELIFELQDGELEDDDENNDHA